MCFSLNVGHNTTRAQRPYYGSIVGICVAKQIANFLTAGHWAMLITDRICVDCMCLALEKRKDELLILIDFGLKICTLLD